MSERDDATEQARTQLIATIACMIAPDDKQAAVRHAGEMLAWNDEQLGRMIRAAVVAKMRNFR